MGKFQPGQSGNAGGRPKSKKLREALSPFIDKAVARLGKLLDSKDPRVALQACRELFDRVYGKALTTAEVTIEDNRAADLGEMIPLTPVEVAMSLKELLTTAEKEMNLPPMPEHTNKERVERLLKQDAPLSPSLYAALHSAEGTRH